MNMDTIWRDRLNLGEESITPRLLLPGGILRVGKARLHRSQPGGGATGLLSQRHAIDRAVAIE